MCLSLSLSAIDKDLFASNLRVIAATGEDAPGGGGTYRLFNEPALNDQGQTAFFARVTAPNGQNEGDYGIFRSNGVNSTAIVRTDQVAPGNSGSYGAFVFSEPRINAPGVVGFGADLLENLGDVQGSPGSFLGDGQIVVSVSDRGTGGATPINGFGYRSLFFRSSFPGDRVVLSDGRTHRESAREGQQSPNGSGTIGTFIGHYANDAGQHAYSYRVSSNGSTSIYLNDSGSLMEMASSGQSYSNAVDSIGVGTIRHFALNESGQVGFYDDLHLAISDASSIQRVAHLGQSSPDGNGVFARFDGFRFNDSRKIAFRAELENTAGGAIDDYGFYYGDENSIATVVREGDISPRGNGIFGDLSSTFFDDFAANDAGHIAFEADLSGSSNGAYEGIFFHDPDVGLMEVVRRSDRLLGSTITEVDFIGDRSVDKTGLNELGQVAFQFRLLNGKEGIAVWSPPKGDFNLDGNWDCDDINALVSEIVAGTHDAGFDLNGDGLVNKEDISDPHSGWWAAGGTVNASTTGGPSFFAGDLNLDGHVASDDLGVLLNNFAATSGSLYCGGDINADSAVDSVDLGLLLNNFANPVAVAVPEPSCVQIWCLLGIAAVICRRRSSS